MITPEKLLEAAKQLEPQLQEWRRTLHRHPEVGFDLPQTKALVQKALTEMGYAPQDCGKCGVLALAGGKKPGKVILLRGDMDALPLQEESGEEFASELPGKMHGCGHDMHTAMLLGAAQLRCLPRGALILDLASRPGGTDFAAARELGLRAEHALSLPARCAPETAGALVAHTVEVILQERAATARSERGVS